MKKIFRKTVRFLIDLSLVIIMMMSAQRCMNLPFSWAGVWYVVLFGVALGIFTEIKINAIYKVAIKNGIEENRIMEHLYKKITEGEDDEFSINAPMFLFKKFFLYFARNFKIVSYKNKEVYYMITELKKLDKENIKVTFSKFNEQNKGE